MSAGNVNVELERSDTGLGLRKVSQIVEYGDFTDDGSDEYGDLTLNKAVPAGSFIIGSKVTVKDGFTGDSSATLQVGSAKNNGDYSGSSTHNVFTSGTKNLVQGTALYPIASNQSIYLTLTSGSDFSDVTAGRLLVEVFYFSTNVELTDGHRLKSDL